MNRYSILLSALLIFNQAYAQDNPPKTEQDPTAVTTQEQITPELQKIIDGVQAYYANINDFKADFSQKYTYKIYQRKKVSAGQVYFKKPSMMRWDYLTPTSRVFVADGNTLWVYEPDEGQVFKRDLSKAQLPVALKFMKGDGKLSDDFKVSLLENNEKEQYSLKLIPKESNADYQSIKLVLNAKTYEVMVSTLIDNVGNENQITFLKLQSNLNLPNDGFKFNIPDGVRVIEGNDQAIDP